MQTVHEPARDIPVVADVDVLVVGGGPAGFIAATAATRLGATVMLVERYGCLGGLATGGLVLYMDCLTDKQGRRLMGGIPWETMERLRPMDGLAFDAPLRIHVDSELLQVVADDMCMEAGVRLKLHAWAVQAITESGRVRGVIIESKSGRQAILCSVCIDATGDGDIAALAGAEYESGTECIGLNMKVAGVDREHYRAFTREEPEKARALHDAVRERGGFPLVPNSTPHSDMGIYWINILGMAARGRPGTGEGADIHAYFAGELSAVDVDDLTHCAVELRRRLTDSLAFYRQNVPGFENIRLLAFAPQIGVRESRMITGEYILSQDDVLAARTFDDAIGMAGIGYAGVGRFQIPYRSLIPRTIDGLLVAGRCISVDHWTEQAARLIPAAMVTGQAAGTAAAMAVQQNISPRRLSHDALRERLAADGAILS
jgi:hypothetical protein